MNTKKQKLLKRIGIVISNIYLRLRTMLVQNPLKLLAICLSHGGVHLILLCVVLFLAIKAYNHNTHMPATVAHNIEVSVYSKYVEPQNGVIMLAPESPYYELKLKLNNDSIKKETNGKYKDAIDVMVSYPGGIVEDSVRLEVRRYPHKNPIEARYYGPNQKYLEAICTCDSDQLYCATTGVTGIIPMPTPPDGNFTDARIYCNDFGVEENSPYYCYRLIFRNIGERKQRPYGVISIELDELKWDYHPAYSNKPIVFEQINPMPDEISGGYISYSDSAKLDEINHNGIFLYAKDLDVEHKMKRAEYQDSVIVGVLFAFALDIIVQLVIKWRNLIRAYRKED